jgi:hypothetical protein
MQVAKRKKEKTKNENAKLATHWRARVFQN